MGNHCLLAKLRVGPIERQIRTEQSQLFLALADGVVDLACSGQCIGAVA